MLAIFRTNQLLISFLLLFYGAALHAFMLVFPGGTSQVSGGILFSIVAGWVPTVPLWQAGTVTLLLFVQAFMLNILEYNYRMNRDINMYPGVFFLLFTSFSPLFQVLSPVYFANIFLFAVLYELMDVSRKQRPEGNLFNAGFFTGIAALFYPTAALFVLVIFIVLNITRGVIFRERIIVLTGFLVAYFLAGTLLYQFDRLPEFLDKQFFTAYSFWDFGKAGISWELLPWAGIMAVALWQQGDFFQKQNMLTQKRISILYWMLFIGLGTVLFQPAFVSEHLLLVALPVGFLAALVFGRMRRNWAEIWHTLLLLFLLLVHYRPLLLKYLS